jgi:hypothetical protein
MSDGALFKPEKDFTKEADKVIPEAEALAKKDIQKGIDKIIVLEKQSRQVYKHHHIHARKYETHQAHSHQTLLQHQGH